MAVAADPSIAKGHADNEIGLAFQKVTCLNNEQQGSHIVFSSFWPAKNFLRFLVISSSASCGRPPAA